MVPTTGISELKIATFPTGLQLISLLYRVKPIVDMAIRARRINIPLIVTTGRVPPESKPKITSSNPPPPKLYPVPTKISTLLPNPRVIRLAKAEHMALSIIMPSPKRENELSLLLLPKFNANIPPTPTMQPINLLRVKRSLLKNRQAKTTTRNTLNEFMIDALAPSLCDKPI